MISTFDEKDPAESVVLTFDFSPGLASGETLTGTITVDVSMALGTDATPTALLNGAASFDASNTRVLQPVKAGVQDANYLLKVTCATTNPKKVLAIAAILPIRV